MNLVPSKLTITEYTATIALAVLLNGLLFWHFLPPDLVSGSRALIVAFITMLLQLILALQKRKSLTKTRLSLIVMLVLQSIILAFSLNVGSFTEYGVWKIQGFLIFAIMPTIFLFLNYWQQPHLIKYLFKTLLLCSFISLFLPIIHPEMLDPEYFRYTLKTLGIDVIGVARSLGTGLLIGIIFSNYMKGWLRLGILSVLLPLFLMMVMIGERGPLLSVFLAVLYFISHATEKKEAWKTPKRLALTSIIGIGGIWALPVLIPRFSSEALRNDGRWDVFSAAFTQFYNSPLWGTGLGAFSPESLITGEREYFHNIFGEILTETGILGLSLLTILTLLPFFLYPIRTACLSNEMRFWLQASKALFVFAFINANVSGDLTTNYLIWISYGLIYCCGYTPKRIDNSTHLIAPPILTISRT